MKNSFLLLSIILLFSSCSEKEIKIIPISDNSYKSSMRGLYAVNENVVWTSGTDGVVLRKVNDKDWTLHLDTSKSKLDFRDIHAFNENEAIIMSSGDGCEIFKTIDGAKSWELVYENYDNGIFFDGMDFWDKQHGIAFSDPVNNQLYLIETTDGGNKWHELNTNALPQILKGEAGFAASGTGIQCVGDSAIYIGTGGGETSRVFVSHNRGLDWEVINTPMRGGDASGIYSITFINDLNGVAVGGNYLDSTSNSGNCVITSDGGLTWKLPKTPPIGYMSCVTHNNDGILLCTGRNGIDISYDKGNNWKHISDDAYYSCVVKNSIGYLTGRGGKMAKVIFE